MSERKTTATSDDDATPERKAAAVARAIRNSGSQPFRHALEFALIEVARAARVGYNDPDTARALYLAVSRICARKRETRRIQNAPLERMLMDIDLALAKLKTHGAREGFRHIQKYIPEDVRERLSYATPIPDDDLIALMAGTTEKLVYVRGLSPEQAEQARTFELQNGEHLQGKKLKGAKAVAVPNVPLMEGDLVIYHHTLESAREMFRFHQLANGYMLLSSLPSRRGTPRTYSLIPSQIDSLWRVMQIERDGEIIADFSTGEPRRPDTKPKRPRAVKPKSEDERQRRIADLRDELAQLEHLPENEGARFELKKEIARLENERDADDWTGFDVIDG